MKLFKCLLFSLALMNNSMKASAKPGSMAHQVTGNIPRSVARTNGIDAAVIDAYIGFQASRQTAACSTVHMNSRANASYNAVNSGIFKMLYDMVAGNGSPDHLRMALQNSQVTPAHLATQMNYEETIYHIAAWNRGNPEILQVLVESEKTDPQLLRMLTKAGQTFFHVVFRGDYGRVCGGGYFYDLPSTYVMRLLSNPKVLQAIPLWQRDYWRVSVLQLIMNHGFDDQDTARSVVQRFALRQLKHQLDTKLHDAVDLNEVDRCIAQSLVNANCPSLIFEFPDLELSRLCSKVGSCKPIFDIGIFVS